ncbi:hypothetical protein [Mucilaginibacter segetis]|uniref:UDP-N-acetylglucosamine kinase n=1 Tax=Mucilaginibacter segetis TaxID=2793071 RepID=A0A934PSI4_9SPHI|nr:hypothetical protein [Mucilaginibacter segetis]MBK0379274.1 hypothetical protein [Mucilaginibacter segetis]
MACIYIIAGPPGIGKSTSGHEFIPENIDIWDADMIAQRYRHMGYTDYKDIGNMRFQQSVQRSLISGEDFAIELNLGFQSHYDYLRKVKSFNADNSIHIVLFYTEQIALCLERARRRHTAGLHLVQPETIHEMYAATFTLLRAHLKLVDRLTLVDVMTTGTPYICGGWSWPSTSLQLKEDAPRWASQLNEDLKAVSKQQIKRKPRGPRL